MKKTKDDVRCPRWIDYVDEFNKPKSALLPDDKSATDWRAKAHDDKGHILITGETGVGKDELARVLWNYSPRFNKRYHGRKKKAPTVAPTGGSFTGKDNDDKSREPPFKEGDRLIRTVNCASLSPSLIVGELFGHVKGAFTDAISDRDGLLLSVDGGTVILEELGALPKYDQARILLFIQTGQIQKIGSDEKPKQSDVRVIATTNVDPNDERYFRQDLRNRFAFEINLPPLHERRQDIPLLITEFMKSYECYVGIDPIWLFELMSYEWPGNIRDLYQYCESVKKMARYHADAKTNVQPDQDNINRVLSKDSKSDIKIKTAKHFHKAAFYDRLPPTEREIAARKDAKKQDPEHCDYLEIPTKAIPDEFNSRYDIQQHPKEWLADNDIHPAYIAEELLESYQRTYGKQKIIPPYISNMLYLLTGFRTPFKEEPIVKLGLPFQCLEHNPKCFDISIIHKSKTSVCVSLNDAMVALIDYREFQYQMLLEAEDSNLYDVDDVLSQIFDARVKPDFIKRIVETGHTIPGYVPITENIPVKTSERGRPTGTKNISDEVLVNLLRNASEMGIKSWVKLKPMLQKTKHPEKEAHKTSGGLDKRIDRIDDAVLRAQARSYFEAIFPPVN